MKAEETTDNLKKGKEKREKEEKRDFFKEKKSYNFGKIFTKSIIDSLNTTFLLLGVVTCFLVLTTILQSMIPMEDFVKIFLSGLLEMTQGIKLVGTSSFSLFFKGLLILVFLSFGGFSIHMQVLSFLSEQNLRYFPYFWSRILQVILASILYFLFFPLLFH